VSFRAQRGISLWFFVPRSGLRQSQIPPFARNDMGRNLLPCEVFPHISGGSSHGRLAQKSSCSWSRPAV
jgi:hypothetical protein